MAQITLGTCPSVVHRNIIEYLAPRIIVKCDTAAYLRLQNCCNYNFARETVSILKKPLQTAQAVLAQVPPIYYLSDPAILHNPIFMNTLCFSDFFEIFSKDVVEDMLRVGKPGLSDRQAHTFAKLLIAYGQSLTRTLSSREPKPEYIGTSRQHVARSEEVLLSENHGSGLYKLHHTIECYELSEHIHNHGEFHHFEYAISLYQAVGSHGIEQYAFMACSTKWRFMYIRGNGRALVHDDSM
ncbi:hypothetical protein HDV00_001990 [Rhizophlyctis rosea]|nr:hypothetical protein HDV00_001990 [Rhizophlyctis rosea]